MLKKIVCGVVLCCQALAVTANTGQVVGWVEIIGVPVLGVNAKAKLDTGALTSSIHATNVARFTKDDEKWVRFTISLQDAASKKVVERELERPLHRRVKVFGAGGADSRLVVFLAICVGDQLLNEQFSLSNRKDKNYGLLIGRRTLQHIGLLDVRKTFTLAPQCDA